MQLMTKIRDYCRFLLEMAHPGCNEWQVAIRKREGKTLYEGNGDGFYIVPNSVRYWRADPFLFTHCDQDYLFVEMFDRWKKKGVLGVSRIRNGKCGRFKVCLDLPWHLSYPCVFENKSGIYMVPECYQSEEVAIYRCTNFPLKWEKDSCILKGIAVDTTPYGEKWLTTRFPSLDERVNNNLWLITADGKTKLLKQEDFCARGAGHIIRHSQNEYIRPSQNCAESYGNNIQFNRILCENGEEYKEEAFLSIYAPHAQSGQDVLCVDSKKMGKRKYNGIHTYNLNAKYEVIDLKVLHPVSMTSFVRKYGNHIKRKIRGK